MGVLAWRARAGLLLLAGAVVVHQLVYGLAGVRPDEHAHAYLTWLTPALFGLVVAGAAEVVLRALGVGRRGSAPPPRGRVLWPVLSLLLVAAFVSQEAAETLLTPGDAHGHAVSELVLAHGLWIVFPIALLVGAILALVLRGAAAVEAWGLAIVPAPAPAQTPFLPARPTPARTVRAPRDLLGRHLAGRAPPLAVA